MRSWMLLMVLATVSLSLGHAHGAQRITLTGGHTGPLGYYLSGGIEMPAGELTETLGLTWSETVGIEPLTTLSYSHPVGDGWTLNAVAGYGGLGGDYRVDRLPEVHLTSGLAIPGVPFSYSLDIGAGYFTVRPGNLSGFRESLTAQLNANVARLSPDASLSGGVGYTYQMYGNGNPNGAATGTVNLALTHSPSLSTTFTYFRQMATGSSPLVFDNLAEDSYAIGLASLTLSPGVTLQHSQKYSFISASVVDRVYSVVVTIQPVNLTISYDDVPHTWGLGLTYAP